MLISDLYHLTYCTNIHPGENWEVTLKSLEKNVPEVKKQVSPTTNFGLGLRLSNAASKELGLGDDLKDFKNWLNENGVYVFTMNGFPFGNFHGERVKDNVHQPDWTTKERLDYTKRLFRQLTYLLPEGVSGGISTSPISYKYWHISEKEKKAAMHLGAQNMVEVAVQLYQIEEDTGKYLHLDIEPEPDGLLENSQEVLDFFSEYLVPIGIQVFDKEFNLSKEEAERCVKKYLTICYDICHFSLAYEEPEDTLGRFSEHGIRVGKIQVSAALKISSQGKNLDEIWRRLQDFDEPTYLHQVTEQVNGQVKTYSDLPDVLNAKKTFEELRAHFHVPIFLEKFGVLESTQDHIVKVIDYLKTNSVSKHLEVETYTWEVLPENLKVPISESIVRELNWLKERI